MGSCYYDKQSLAPSCCSPIPPLCPDDKSPSPAESSSSSSYGATPDTLSPRLGSATPPPTPGMGSATSSAAPRTQYNLPLVSCTYRYDPYATTGDAKIIEEEVFALPEDTLHTELADQVSFLPYPSEKFTPHPQEMHKDKMTRVFLGQLPYQVTDMQIQWLCSSLGNGAAIFFPERIVKQDKETFKTKIPTGCVHAYCPPEHVDGLISGLHKRLLIDDTGVWYADNSSELEVLHRYTSEMKKTKSLRPHNRPYDTVVAQVATSTFVRKPPHYNQVATSPPAYPGLVQPAVVPSAPHRSQPAVASPSVAAPPPPPCSTPPPFFRNCQQQPPLAFAPVAVPSTAAQQSPPRPSYWC